VREREAQAEWNRAIHLGLVALHSRALFCTPHPSAAAAASAAANISTAAAAGEVGGVAAAAKMRGAAATGAGAGEVGAGAGFVDFLRAIGAEEGVRRRQWRTTAVCACAREGGVSVFACVRVYAGVRVCVRVCTCLRICVRACACIGGAASAARRSRRCSWGWGWSWSWSWSWGWGWSWSWSWGWAVARVWGGEDRRVYGCSDCSGHTGCMAVVTVAAIQGVWL
jgi:hypothetical protein